LDIPVPVNHFGENLRVLLITKIPLPCAEFSIARGGKILFHTLFFFFFWFSMCSHKCRRMIKDLYFIFGLEPDLAKSS
jgi:hypothetical protein